MAAPRTSVTRFALVAAAGATVALSACSDSAETGIEQLIEQQGGGNVDIDSDDGSFSIQTEDGSMTVDDEGNFVVTDGDGSMITGNADSESGEFNIESEDGSFSSGSTSELPEDWPADVPTPDGMTITTASSMDSTDGSAIQLSGTTDDPASFVADYTSQLENSGFTAQADAVYDGEDNWAAVYENSSYTVVLNVVAFEGETPVVGLGVFSDPSE
jgi:hypothetical protein